ncbi:MAG: ATP-binding cassette domain-containing protein [Gemmataceae bacterium]
MTSMLHVDRVSKFFGPIMALNNVSFDVGEGEIVGFLGPNGAGKSTMMRILTTYLPATQGIAKVAGYDVMTESMEVRQNIGYLPESVPLYGEMRVEEYLMYRAKLKGVSRRERPSRLEKVLAQCRVKEVRRRQIGTLSKGYRQRVGLADAMIHDPPILILDEPTAGLDPIQIRETLRLIKALGENHTIMLSTHILAEVEAICERVIIINAGRVSVQQTLEELETEALTVLEVRGPREQVVKALQEVKGVTDVSTSDGDEEDEYALFEVQAEEEADLREELFAVILKNQWALRSLERRRRKLEDAFFEVIRADDPLGEYVSERVPGQKGDMGIQDLERDASKTTESEEEDEETKAD